MKNKTNDLDITIPPKECFPNKGIHEYISKNDMGVYKPLTIEEFKKVMYDLFWSKHEKQMSISPSK
jgi:predicted transcriptional regulator